MRALALVDDWPVGAAAAAVCDRGGVAAVHGERGRPFAWASVTKLVTSVAALVAVEDESIGLDDGAGPPGSTVRHLLAHASGLAPDDPSLSLAPPGSRRIYSNAGFEVLASAVAGAVEMDFAAYAAEAVFSPLGMTGAALGGSPAAGAWGTIDDLAALGADLLSPTLLAGETMALATSVAFPGLAGVLPGFGRQDPCDWGLGFELRDGKSPHWTGSANAPETFGHFGRSGTFLWVDPVAGVSLGVLTDRDFGDWAAQAWPILGDAVLAEVTV